MTKTQAAIISYALFALFTFGHATVTARITNDCASKTASDGGKCNADHAILSALVAMPLAPMYWSIRLNEWVIRHD